MEFSREQQTLCTFATKATRKNCSESPLADFTEKNIGSHVVPENGPTSDFEMKNNPDFLSILKSLILFIYKSNNSEVNNNISSILCSSHNYIKQRLINLFL